MKKKLRKGEKGMQRKKGGKERGEEADWLGTGGCQADIGSGWEWRGLV